MLTLMKLKEEFHFGPKPTVMPRNSCTLKVYAEGLGDKPLVVDFDNPASLKEAQALIDDLRKVNTSYFKEQPNGEGGGKVTEKDGLLKPDQNLLAVPQMLPG